MANGTVVTLAAKPGISLTLAQNLERTGRHPVLIFGATNSGKSSLIISLIQALQGDRRVSVTLGEPVLDKADPDCEEKHRAAKGIFQKYPYYVDAGLKIPGTRADPFFVPVDVMPKNSQLEPVKFAFLDGRGEAYEPNHAEDMDFYKPLNDDIRDLLQNFSYGITFIYVAPYSISAGHDRDTRESNFGLLGALQAYRELRAMRRNDFHLFLLTKWDQYASPMAGDGLFDRPTAADVDVVLYERYKQAWGTFQTLPLEGAARDRRAFTQYTSGFYVNGEPQRPPANFEASFGRYPRTVLNWLYGNATQFRLTSDTEMLTLRKILFDDVVLPHTPRVTMTEWFASLLTAR